MSEPGTSRVLMNDMKSSVLFTKAKQVEGGNDENSEGNQVSRGMCKWDPANPAPAQIEACVSVIVTRELISSTMPRNPAQEYFLKKQQENLEQEMQEMRRELETEGVELEMVLIQHEQSVLKSRLAQLEDDVKESQAKGCFPFMQRTLRRRRRGGQTRLHEAFFRRTPNGDAVDGPRGRQSGSGSILEAVVTETPREVVKAEGSQLVSRAVGLSRQFLKVLRRCCLCLMGCICGCFVSMFD